MAVSRSRSSLFTALILLWILSTSIVVESVASPMAGDQAVKPGHFDGPAELPRIYVQSQLTDTPAPGKVRLVKQDDNLQDAIDSAKCGDTLKLQAGATFRGLFRVPAKPCDDSHWIILRTSAPDDTLPPEGTRITPCYAGIPSLPGRPDFRCAAVRNVLAKIEFDRQSDSGPILFQNGANHYRLIGLEITRAEPGLHMRNLIQPGTLESTAHHLVFDRLWLHGTAQDETKGGIHLSGITHAAIVDSYFTDFHCIALKGSCTDAQAINGGGRDAPGGPYKIVNNFLEASGENIMFGGAPGSTTPADIEIRRNHFFKPMIWKLDQPGFVGSATGNAFIVKNLFELKNAQRVLFEGNVLENVWGGFSQTGFAILLTPANQDNACPVCRVTDVTIRYNKIRHCASVLQIAIALNKAGTSAAAGERYSIHDLVVDDIDGEAYKGFGNFLTIVSINVPIKDVLIDHVTAFPPRALITIQNGVNHAKLGNFTITNNVFNAGPRQIASAGGGRTNCATVPGNHPEDLWNSCFDNSTFAHNLIIDGKGSWPGDNVFISAGDAGISDLRKANASQYRPCAKKGAACKKLPQAGADIEAIEKATAGVD